MKLFSIGQRIHVQVAGGYVDVAAALGEALCPAAGLTQLLALDHVGLMSGWGSLLSHPPTCGVDAALEPPLQPLQLFDGYTFESHVRNARARRGLEVPPEWYDAPVYYRSNPRNLVAPGGVVPFPLDEPEPDYELELACVIGRRLFRPTLAEAQAAIFGYTLLNDFSARFKQRQAMKVGLGPNPGKDFASGLGPCVVSADEIGDVSKLVLTAHINGEEWSRGMMGDARWSLTQLVAYIAQEAELLPGDVIASGTVGGGCGLELGRVVPDGARIDLYCAPIGQLTHYAGRASALTGF